jgi:hypothetical protein
MATASVYDARSMFAGMKRPKPSKDFDVAWHLCEIADAEAEKLQHQETWRSAMDLTMPQRQNFDHQQAGQRRQPQQKFDSYPEDAMLRGIGNTIGALWPPGQQWSEVAPGNRVDPKKADALSKGTEKITDTIFEYLDKSLFYTELHTATHDLMVSTMFLAIDEGDDADNPFRVRSGNLDEMTFTVGPTGEAENVYRKYKCRPEHIERSYPAAKLSQRIRLLVEQKSRDKVEVVEATTWEPGRGYRFTVFDPSDKHIFYDVPPTDPSEPCRWIVSRLYVRPGDRWGYGPAVVALSEMRTVNKTKELSLLARAKLHAPPTLFDTRTGINPQTVRLGANYVGVFDGSALQGSAPFYQLPAGGNTDWSTEDMRDSHALIDRILLAEEDIPPADEFRDRTAYEVQTRKQMKLVQRGVNLGRLQREGPNAAVRRCLWILAKKGLLGEIVPEVLAEMLKKDLLQVKPLGPIAVAQRAEKAQGTLQFVTALRSAVGDDAAALSVKIEDVGADVGKMWPGLNNSLLRDEQEREKMQAEAAQIMAQQAAGAAPTAQQSALPGMPAA